MKTPHPQIRIAVAGLFGIFLVFSVARLIIVSRVAGSGGHVEAVWGRRGISAGRLQKPRAMAIDKQDNIYVVDMTARIQVFDRDGNFLRGWKTPTCENGRPTGLTIDQNGDLLVADTHYFRVLCYSPTGELRPDKVLGGEFGNAPGQFGMVTDAERDSHGNLYVAEYGQHDRIQKFSPEGRFLCQWGGHGSEPGQFIRPQNIAIDVEDQIWVADACNHRIQVFDTHTEPPQLVRCWGTEGSRPGKLKYPYDLALDGKGYIYVCEFGNHRVQKFNLDGQFQGLWGNVGRKPGQLHNPWALVLDSHGAIHVLDTYNHRVQRIRM